MTKERPQNCGTGYCSCIECLMKPDHIEDNLVMVTRSEAWKKQLTSAQRNELKQIDDGTWEADRNG